MLKSSKTKHHSQDLRDDIAEIKAIMSNTAYEVKDSASDILTDSFYLAKEKSSILNDNIREYIRKKPVKSLAIGFLSGLGIGFLIKRF